MDRRAVVRGALAAGIIAVAGLALATCSNPIDIVGAIQTEVMVANNKFLVVNDSGPSKNATGVAPSSSLWVEFDRDLDVSSIKPDTITILPDGGSAVAWTFTYDSGTQTLNIIPSVLQSTTWYTVTVNGLLKGTDGSDLQANFTFRFQTKDGPSGSFTINSAAPYATSTSATLNLSYNIAAKTFRWSTDPALLTNQLSTGVQTNFVSLSGTSHDEPITLASGDGGKTIYGQFWNVDNSDYTSIVFPPSASIVLDTVDPTATSVDVANTAGFSAANTTLTLVASDATSGVAQMQFSNDSGTTWSGWEPYSPTRTGWNLGGVDGSHTVEFMVMDAAGRPSTAVVSTPVTKDGTAPTATLNVDAGATYTNLTSATLALSATDAGSGVYQVRYSNSVKGYGAWESFGASKSWTLATGDGAKTVYFQVKDNVGNIRTVTHGITLDQTPPVISAFTITGSSGSGSYSQTASVTLNITATDATSGLSQSQYGNYGQSWGAWEGFASTKAWTLNDHAGTQTVYINVKDAAGNSTTVNANHTSILLYARILVTYTAIYVSNNGVAPILGIAQLGSMYYWLYGGGSLIVDSSGGPQAMYGGNYVYYDLPSALTLYRDPTSGATTVLQGYLWNTGGHYGYGSKTITAPYTSGTVTGSYYMPAQSGTVAGYAYYSFNFQNP